MTNQRKIELLAAFSNLLDAIQAAKQGKEVYLLKNGKRSYKGKIVWIGFEDIQVSIDFEDTLVMEHIYIDYEKTEGFTEYTFEIIEKEK